MPTVSDLIHSSFRLISAIAAGETLETYELNDAFISLNQMLSSWNTEGASIAGRNALEIPVNPGNQSYSLAIRPVHIESASIHVGPVGIDVPLRIVDSTGWDGMREKQALTVYTEVVFCDYAFPNSSVFIAPLPRLGGTLELWLWQTIEAFSSLTQTVDLPPGYEKAIRYNFAVAVLPEYPRSQVDPTLVAQAQAFKNSIVALNRANHMVSTQAAPLQAAISDAAQTAVR